jgi:hypothetical protein
MTTMRPTPAEARLAGDRLAPRSGDRRRRGRGRLTANPSWPITALLVGYPLWWALGIADFMWMILAIPMAARMFAWRAHGSRRLRVPPAFGIWLLFLICAVAGVVVLSLTAPGTVPSPVSNRVLAYAIRTTTYMGVTVLLLYAGNLTEDELPRRRLAWMLGLVAIYATIGGVAGMALPHLQFSSPFQLLLPKSTQLNPSIVASTHPALSQVQNVLGVAKGRPKAPFDYTNTWGDCLTILLPWLIVGWWRDGRRRQRLIAVAVPIIAAVPLLYSLNRAAWIGVGVSIVFLAMWLAAKGRLALIGALCAGLALAGILVLATPLQGIVTGRLANGKSDNLRGSLSALAITDALASPVIGYGDTRKQNGSPTSIAVGPTRKCPTCGQQEVGSTGQLWLLLVCNGIVGTVLYLAFFGVAIWRYRHDGTPYGMAGVLVLLLSFVYMFTYVQVGAALGFTMLAYALLWRGDLTRQQETQQARTAPSPRFPRRVAATAEITG